MKKTISKCPACGQRIITDGLKDLSMDKKTRDLIAKHFESLPIYHMRFRFLSMENGRVRDTPAEKDEWFLPLMKRKVKQWNEEAGNPDSDPNHENYAWYVRVK